MNRINFIAVQTKIHLVVWIERDTDMMSPLLKPRRKSIGLKITRVGDEVDIVIVKSAMFARMSALWWQLESIWDTEQFFPVA